MMLTAALGQIFRNDPQALVEVDILPACLGEFRAALTY